MNPDSAARITKVADWLALACLSAMVSLPLLHPRHFNPIPSFWSEWWAFAFGLGAAALLLIRPGAWRPFGLPEVAAIPLVFLATALVQYFAGRWYFVEPWLIYALYLLWAFLMLLASRSFVDRRGLTPLADTLAVAILFGAFCNTVISALQFYKTGYQSGWVFVRLAAVPYSNLGQANHFNHQLWLGIASLYYLHLRNRCRLTIALPAMLLLLLASTMSSSKSTLLYALAFTLVAGAMHWRLPSESNGRKLWRLALPLLPMVLLAQLLVRALGIAGDASSQLATQRLFSDVGGYQIRWRLARSAWNAFVDSPLLGNGIGTYPWQLFLDCSRYALGQGPQVAEHAHNIVLQLLAEFGIIPVAIALWLLLRWAVALWRQPWRIEHWWLLSMLSVAAIHSMLEYPLWYSFFLGPVALLLGASARPAVLINNGWRGAAMCAMVIGVGVVPLTTIRLDYTRLEQSYNVFQTSSGIQTRNEQIDTLVNIQTNSLLAPHVVAALSSMMELNDNDLEAKVVVCRQGMRFSPARSIVFKCGTLMAMAGDDKGALAQTEQALRAYPKEATRLAADLRKLEEKYPRVKVLLPLVDRYAQPVKQLP